MRVRRFGAAALAAALVGALSPDAHAFCGFFVEGAGARLFNDATMVVLMREGERTVLAIENTYAGPPADFAMVVPVPVVLAKENVRTLPPEVFDHVDRLAAPRLVEYWEADPCAPESADDDLGGLGLVGTGRGGGGTGEGTIGLGVTVEARFAVGEYEVVILSAKDSTGLETWLHAEGYRIPDGAEPLLRPYVAAGSKFFVAKVDIAKVKMDGGRAVLSPLRFHYDTPDFSLPVRLGLINSAGTQDLIVHILSREGRFDVANYDNVTIPTNLDVAEATRGAFGAFYAALFDATLAKSPHAVVTEYAWNADSCDPCPTPALAESDLATLGADVLPSTHVGGLGSVGIGTLGKGYRGGGGSGAGMGVMGFGRVSGGPEAKLGIPETTGAVVKEVVRRYLRRELAALKYCYASTLVARPDLAGRVTLHFTIDAKGKVTASSAEGTLDDAKVRDCVAARVRAIAFPPLGAGEVTVAIDFSVTKATPLPPAPPVGTPGMVGPGLSFGGGFVLTRLHARYGKDALGEDLVFRKAPPIAGGRERLGDGGTLEKGARPDSADNFQARYVIRHPWSGPIACKAPRRGRWGGPPAGTVGPDGKPVPLEAGGAGAAMPATDLAHAPRGTIALASYVREDVPELGVKPAAAATAAAAAAAAPAPGAVPPAATAAGTDTASATGADRGAGAAAGCGCRLTGGSPSAAGLVLLLLGLGALLRRKH